VSTKPQPNAARLGSGAVRQLVEQGAQLGLATGKSVQSGHQDHLRIAHVEESAAQRAAASGASTV
jgi:hypothetical protein